jgi:hypothetical protein
MVLRSQLPEGWAPGQTRGPLVAASVEASSAAPSAAAAASLPDVPPSVTSPPSPDVVNEGEPHPMSSTTAPASARRENAILLG